MKSVVILQNHAGYPKRVEALKRVHPNVFAVSPFSHPHPGHTLFTAPKIWLPTDPRMDRNRRHWWKSDHMGFAAVQALKVRADFYWFIESDVVATQQRWRALFRDWEGDDTDFVSPSFLSRLEAPNKPVWKIPGNLDWVTHAGLVCIFRLSHRALTECIRCAPEMREVISEVSVPSVVARAGFSLAGLNKRQTHCNSQCVTPCEPCHILYPDLINHPIKRNTLDPG